MSTNGKRFLYQFARVKTVLRGIAGVDSYHLMTSVLSFAFKNSEKQSPTGIHDAFCKVMVFHHVQHLKVLYNDRLIAFSIGLCYFEEEITTLTAYFQMGCSNVTGALTVSVASLLTTGKCSLFASQRLLRCAIEARVLNRLPFTICQEGFQANIYRDRGTVTRRMLRRSRHFTDDEGVPFPVCSQYQRCRFRSAFKWSMKLDLDGLSNLSRNNKMFLILMHITIFAVLSQLKSMPLGSRFKTREANLNAKLFTGQKTFEGLTKTVSKALYCCRRDICTPTPFESGGQIILARKGLCHFILLLNHLKHLIIELASFDQALHEQVRLFFCRVQPIFKRFHTSNWNKLESKSQDSHSPSCLKAEALWLFMVECGDPELQREAQVPFNSRKSGTVIALIKAALALRLSGG
jgi:hypothetical protein